MFDLVIKGGCLPDGQLADIGIEGAVQEHVHFADSPRVKVHLLPKQREIAWVSTMLSKIGFGLDQHTT